MTKRSGSLRVNGYVHILLVEDPTGINDGIFGCALCLTVDEDHAAGFHSSTDTEDRVDKEVVLEMVLGGDETRSESPSVLRDTAAGSEEGEAEEQGGTKVSFEIEFQFRSILLEKLIGAVFEAAARKMISAFEERAAQLALPL